MEEAEYLATLSNFHWFVYPFFKTIEVACDKIFGCKKHAEEYNEKRRAEVMERQVKRNEARQQRFEEVKSDKSEYDRMR